MKGIVRVGASLCPMAILILQVIASRWPEKFDNAFMAVLVDTLV